MRTQEQEALDDLARLFPVMACGQVQDIKKTLIDIKTLYAPQKEQKIKAILPLLERLKKQSVSFGYPLFSDVVVHMEKLIQNSDSFSEARCAQIYKDVLLLQEILWKKIRGDGGEKGRKILNQLPKLPKKGT